jgi:hypothetical protein
MARAGGIERAKIAEKIGRGFARSPRGDKFITAVRGRPRPAPGDGPERQQRLAGLDLPALSRTGVRGA